MRDVDEQVLARKALADSEHHYRLLAENATDVVYLVDSAGVFTWVSPAVRQVLGYDPTDLVGTTTIADLIHPDDQQALRSVVTRVVKGETGVRFELRVRTVTGHHRWMAGVTSRAVGAAGALDEGIGALRDVHEQVLARQALAESERLFRLALDGAPQGMAVVGLDLKFQTVNSALCTMLGRDEQWLLAHTVREVTHPDDLAGDLSGRDELLNGASTARIRECRWRRSDGSSLWVVHSISLLRDAADLPLFYVSHVQDNTDAHRHQAELAHRASHDALTGLINRGQLQEHLTKMLGHPRRRGGVPSLLFCDLDHFKQVNDTYGHAVGDDVLRIAAERMGSVLRVDDILARLGGDEFVVVLNEVHDLAAAQGVAEKIRNAISQPMPIGEAQITITTSIGVALTGPGIAADQLLSNADAALYEAKKSGRDQTAAFDTVTDGASVHQHGPPARSSTT